MDSPDPDRLAQIPLFEGLTDDQLRRLAGWLTVDQFDVGRSPMHASQHGYAFFVLDEGRARAELDGQVLEQLEPGAVFGEMAFFTTNSRRSATIVAETPIRVFSMFGTHFREMQTEMPEVGARLQRLVDERTARMGGTAGESS
jgi:CRP-like cAMP-binding protein